MSIIKPKMRSEKIKTRIIIQDTILVEIKQYCDFAGFKKVDDFFEEAALHILAKDKDYKDWKEGQIQA